jgi:hypothetical protein
MNEELLAAAYLRGDEVDNYPKDLLLNADGSEEILMNCDLAAKFLRMSPSGVRKLVKAGRLCSYRVGSGKTKPNLRFSKKHLQNYLNSCETETE